MSFDQQITVVGTATDPTLRFTASGKAVVSFSIAVNDSRKTDRGGWEQIGTTWWRVSAWDQMAENIAESVAKGMRVIVTGPIKSEEKVDQNGEKQTYTQIDAKAVGVDLKWATAQVTRNERSTGQPQQQARPPQAVEDQESPF